MLCGFGKIVFQLQLKQSIKQNKVKCKKANPQAVPVYRIDLFMNKLCTRETLLQVINWNAETTHTKFGISNSVA